MFRIVCPSLVAFVLGTTLASAEPAPTLVTATGHPGIEIPAGTTLKPAATATAAGGAVATALAFDDTGRILIAENPRPGASAAAGGKPMAWYLDDLAAQKTAERPAFFEKWKDQIAPPYLPAKSGQLRRLTDVHGDGVFEQSTVLAGGFKPPLDGALGGVFVHQGGVYLACIPNLWLLAEPHSDGVTDPRKSLLDGFGVRLSPAGHDLRGFTLGPDGRLYGTIGDRGLNVTTKDGKTHTYPNQGCAFRIEADGTGFEVFFTGLRDPQGIAFDALGNPFTAEAASGLGDPARLVYLAEGGDSGWHMELQALHDFHTQIGLTDAPPTPWIDEHMWELRHVLQPAYILPSAAHLGSDPAGLTIHPGTGFLQAEAGRLLICEHGRDAAHSGINSFELKPDGAGMQLGAPRPLLRGIAATAVQYSWDGRLFLTADAATPLYSLDAAPNTWLAAKAADTAKLIREGFTQLESAELATLLRHPDARIRLRAQIALTRKPDALQLFAAATTATDLMEQVHGIWGLGILARRGFGSPLPSNAGFGDIPDHKISLSAGQVLAGLLKHPLAEIRAQAARAIGDAQNQFIRPPDPRKPTPSDAPPPLMTAEGLPLGALLFDESPRVRFFAAIAIGKLKALGFYGTVCDFLKTNNNSDPYLRHAGAYALQHLVTSPIMLAGLERSPSPAVRLAATVALRRMHDPAAATFINDPDPQVADEAIRAVTDLSLDEVRVSLAYLLDDLPARPWQPFMLRRLIHNAFRLGTAHNAARLLKLVGNPTIPEPIQKESLRLLALWLEPPPVDQLTGIWSPLPKRDPAEIKPALNAELPRLLKLDGFVRSAALELSKQYQLTTPPTQTQSAAPTAAPPAAPAR